MTDDVTTIPAPPVKCAHTWKYQDESRTHTHERRCFLNAVPGEEYCELHLHKTLLRRLSRAVERFGR